MFRMNVSSVRLVAALAWLGCAWTEAHAQEPGACSPSASDGDVTLAGWVFDEGSGVPLPSAVITAAWSVEEGDTVRVEVRAGEGGFYRFCGLPTGVRMTLHASFGERATDPLTARLESPPVAYDFRVPATTERPEATVAVAAGAPGRLVGRVRDLETLRPVENAVVTLRRADAREGRVGPETGEAEALRALTDSQGRFLIREVGAGTYALELRHVAYGTVREPIHMPRRRTLEVDLRVPPVAIELEPIVVTALRDPRLERRGFYERREWGERIGAGHFFDREDVRRRAPGRISHFLGELPGLRVQCAGESDRIPSGRGCRVRPTRTTCSHVTVYVNGIRVMEGTSAPRTDDLTIDDFVNTSEIAAVEVYSGAASLPGEYAGVTGRCGVVAVWTG